MNILIHTCNNKFNCILSYTIVYILVLNHPNIPHTAGPDFTMNLITVIFSHGLKYYDVEIPITDDSIIEETELFSATLSTSDPAVEFIDNGAIINIFDDDG